MLWLIFALLLCCAFCSNYYFRSDLSFIWLFYRAVDSSCMTYTQFGGKNLQLDFDFGTSDLSLHLGSLPGSKIHHTFPKSKMKNYTNIMLLYAYLCVFLSNYIVYLESSK